jgi:hypothetical protein
MLFAKKDSSISPYAKKIVDATKRQMADEILTKGQSKAILINDCPFCRNYLTCAGMVKDYLKQGQIRMPCLLRSDDTVLVWLSIREDDRPVVKMGDKYGKLLVVIPQKPDDHGNRRWLCKCDCGKGKIVRGDNLLTGNTVSCGCDQAKHEVASSGAHSYPIEEEKKSGRILLSDIVEAKIEPQWVIGSLPHRDATGTESKCGRSIDVTLLIDNEGESYPFEVAGLCSECGGVIRFDDHGYKTCVDCGVESSPEPDTSEVPASAKLTDVNDQYSQLVPHESYGQIPDDDLAKLILLKEIAMSDYIDHWQGEWGSVQQDTFDPEDKHAPAQISYNELCSPTNKVAWIADSSALATTKQEEEHDYVAEFKKWCDDMLYASTHRPS